MLDFARKTGDVSLQISYGWIYISNAYIKWSYLYFSYPSFFNISIEPRNIF